MRALKLVIFLTLISTLLYALPQFGDVGRWMFDVAHRAEEGSIAVFLTTDLAVERKEAYLGETLWLAFQIRNAYSPCPLSITIRDASTGDVVFQRSATLNVCGGQALGGLYYTAIIPSFRIVEPVFEGRRYKIEVRAGGEYGAYTFVERHNPVGKITVLTVYSGGRPVGKLRAGEVHELRVRVRNEGEIDYKFKVRLYLDGSLVNQTEVFVYFRREAEAVLQFVPRSVGTANLTVVVGGVVDTDMQSLYLDVTYPHPKFVLVEPDVVEGVAGRVAQGTLRLKNYGEVCKSPRFDAVGGFLNISNSYHSQDVPPGGLITLTYRYVPAQASVGNFTLYVTCGEWRDVVYVPYKFYGEVRVELRDAEGRAVPSTPVIAGEARGEARLLPGEYEVAAPPYVELTGGARYAFVKWGDGVSTPRRTVRVGPSQVLSAVYVLQYHVVLYDGGSKVFDGWVNAGGVVKAPIPAVRPINQTVRERFSGWEGQCPPALNFSVNGPLECRAKYRTEYYVEVVDPLGRYGVAGWYTNFTHTFSAEVFEKDVRYVFIGSNCPYKTEGAFIRLSFAGTAQCRLEWRREYRVEIVPGLGGAAWEGWLAEGAVLRYTVGAVLKADQTGLTVPQWVERGEIRYVPAGWDCGGAEVVVNRPLTCTAQWKRQYRVTVEVVVDGQTQKVDNVWVNEGEALRLSADAYEPKMPPLVTAQFDGWEVSGQLIKQNEVVIQPPSHVKALWKTLNWGIIAAAAAAVAAVVFYTVKRARRPKIILEEMGEETKTR